MDLPEPLGAFRRALQQEVKAVSDGASGLAVELVEGRRRAKIGASFQYSFGLASSLNAPDGMPAVLHLVSGEQVDVSIVSYDGTRVVLSVGVDLGEWVAKASLVNDMSMLLEKLIERIEEKADTSNPCGNQLLNPTLPQGTPANVVFGLDNDERLNDAQREAVQSALGRSLTYIWGPPGTGKTSTIGAICAHAFRTGRSILMVSHTNRAVDEALESMDRTLGGEVVDGEILRIGDPAKKLPGYLLAETHIARRSQELSVRREELAAEQIVASRRVLELQVSLDKAEWAEQAEPDIAELKLAHAKLLELTRDVRTRHAHVTELQAQSGKWERTEAVAREALAARERGLQGRVKLSELRAVLSRLSNDAALKSAEVATAKELLERTRAANWLVRRWKDLPTPEVQEAVLHQRETELAAVRAQLDAFAGKEQELSREVGANERAFKRLTDELGADPEESLARAREWQRNLDDEVSELRDVQVEEARKLAVLSRSLSNAVQLVLELGLGDCHPGNAPEEQLAFLVSSIEQARHVSGTQGIDALRADIVATNERLTAVAGGIEVIEARLKDVEAELIREAFIIATTLTRAYLRDAIQRRKFDMVILDEASMAPIPALWVAASTAAAAVVVGDFLQLPPICQSRGVEAKEWLGRDVFELAGFAGKPPIDPSPHFVALYEQHRMHPSISRIPNSLVYDNGLTDSPTVLDDGNFRDLLAPLTPEDPPVLLVDTGSLNAWVTSVPRGRAASRLNFLSATVCVDLAEAMLKQEAFWEEAEGARVLIACPYRPHASLLNLLLKEQKLTGRVAAGTAHQLQGGEAPVVIFDFVNDEPHWRVGMFNPENDDSTKRLLNVALTRAKRRLVVVGDFDWILSKTRSESFTRRLVQNLIESAPRVEAKALVPQGLWSRVFRSHQAWSEVDTAERPDNLIVTQEAFFDFLLQDIEAAVNEVIIFSPFVTERRLAYLQPALRAAVERGVAVWVVTKAPRDRKRSEVLQYAGIERTLKDWGVRLVHKAGMHEKLAFFDREVVWTGSLNPLSQSTSQEIMERRRTRALVHQYWKTLELDELVKTYERGEGTCPVCGSELIAAEGNMQPFFWRCAQEQCYTRSIGQPHPADGVIGCGACGSAVRYGEWAGKPHWRCVANNKHRQPIRKSHLQLPKMRAMVPSSVVPTLQHPLL